MKTALVTVMLSSVLIVMTGCNQGNSTETQQQITASVTRGDLSLDVSAVGNLAFSEKDTLTFDIAGTVTNVAVQEGDLVKKDQVLATLDESAKTDLLDNLDKTIEQDNQALNQAKINLDNAQAALDALNDPTGTDLKTAQAKLNVYNMQIALENAQDSYDAALERYNNNWTVPQNIRNLAMETLKLQIAQDNLTQAQDAVGQIQTDLDAQIASKQQDLDLVQQKYDDAQNAWREKLLSARVAVTPVLDRKYFRSIYFRDPDGHILEIATAAPGFAVDEPPASLGTDLALPAWLEPERSAITASLTPLLLHEHH